MSSQSMNRRDLLATIGLTAVAGCSSNDSLTTPPPEQTSPADIDSGQTDCIERSDYNRLRNQYENLRNQYEDLRERHINLQNRVRNALLPPFIVSNRRNVSVTYESLDGEVETWQWNSETLESQFTNGFIVREFTYSQLDYLNWNVFGFEGRSKYSRLGDFGLYYQLNPFVIPSNFVPLAEEFHRRHRSDEMRIRAAWNFTTQVNEYVSELQETPRFPLETLLMGGGDCEDSAILLASLVYAMPKDYNVTFWYMDSQNPTDPENINHVVLSAETEEGPMVIETTSDRMRPWGEINGFSVPVRPTRSSVDEYIAEPTLVIS